MDEITFRMPLKNQVKTLYFQQNTFKQMPKKGLWPLRLYFVLLQDQSGMVTSLVFLQQNSANTFVCQLSMLFRQHVRDNRKCSMQL